MIKETLNKEGYVIIPKMATSKEIREIRAYWLEVMEQENVTKRVTWSPYWGMSNHIGFSKDSFQHLYRSYDFLWNTPSHIETMEVCLRINRFRNELLGNPVDYGTRFIDGSAALAATASYYPPNVGFMAEHVDGNKDGKPLIHGLMPITFKGLDYWQGGMFLKNRKGQTLDVDSVLKPGDMVLYDATLPHWVERIQGHTGRLQIFPLLGIEKLEDNFRALAEMPLSKIVAAKWKVFKNTLRAISGRSLSFR